MNILSMLLLVAALIVYLIPTIIVWNKRHYNPVIALNLFLGWTFIGWVAALVWALVDEKPTPEIVVHEPDNLEKIEKLKHLFDSGAITEEEFNSEKKKLLSPDELVTEWKIKN